MKKFNFDKATTATLLSVLGMVLGFAGTALSGMANEKNMETIIEEKVKEALKNQQTRE